MTTTYENSWIVDGPPDLVWALLHPPKGFDRSLTNVEHPRTIQHGTTRVDVLHEGDEDGVGLVRHCWFLAPWYLGGQAQSWEIVSEVRVNEMQRYDVLLCAPPRATVKGWYRLEGLADGRTRVHIHEEYTMQSRWLAPLFEKRIHDFFLSDNDEKFKGIVDDALRKHRAASSEGLSAAPATMEHEQP